MAKSDEQGILHRTDFDEESLVERDNHLKSKREKFIRWKKAERRNKALIESLNFC